MRCWPEGWANNYGDYSCIIDIHNSGRPDNAFEDIPCLDTGSLPIANHYILPSRPYEPPYRIKKPQR